VDTRDEAVPHVVVEEHLQEVIDAAAPPTEEGGEPPQVAVTAVPDEQKGERLIVLHNALPLPIEALLERVAGTDVPKLWIPRRDSFHAVEEIPKLGSGKLDLKAVKQRALELVPGSDDRSEDGGRLASSGPSE